MNHSDMVALAVSCDAIGFRAGVSDEGSILVEVKTSRADFFADRQKRFREIPERGLGHYRYYMAPAGMVAVDELPEKWGLIEIKGSKRPEAKLIHGHHLLKPAQAPTVYSAATNNSNPSFGNTKGLNMSRSRL